MFFDYQSLRRVPFHGSKFVCVCVRVRVCVSMQMMPKTSAVIIMVFLIERHPDYSGL